MIKASADVCYEFGEFRLDPANHLLSRRDGTVVPLTPRAFDTLLFMVEHHGTVLDKERLMEAVWPHSIVEQNNLSQHISTLRRVLGDTPGSHRFIVTVPGWGYRFSADVRIQDANAEDAAAETSVAPAKPELPQNQAKPEAVAATKAAPARPLLIYSAIAALLIIVITASLFALRRHPSSGSATLPPATAAVSEKSIAVLPFADLSPARDQEYFCDGIQEEILTRLAKIADLKVISRTSTQRFRSGPKNLPEIARQLGVANVLEGAVQKADGQVRVTVQLIQARSDSHLWAEKYDGSLSDVFGVESQIAKAIADTLQAKLSGFEQRAITTRPTENAEAHQLYLKGIYFSSKRNAPDLRTAIHYFQEAIREDPNYALAYAGLADAYALLALYGGEGLEDSVHQAKVAGSKALELDEALPEAHNSLGLVLVLYDFDFARSKKEFERAIELNPNYATAHHQFGNMNLAMAGEFDRAIAEGKRAVELDPISLIINADLGQDLMLARRYEQAIDQLRKTLAMDPRFYYARWTLGETLQLKGQLGEAMAEYKKAAEVTDDPIVTALLAQGYAKSGERDKASNLLAQLEQLTKHRPVGSFTFALVHLGLGENEKAMDDIERAYREHDPDLVGIKVEPLLDPLRGDPRFDDLVAKLFGRGRQE